MNELSIEKTMTVKEVAMVLNCTEQTIRNYCNRLFPDKIKNGLTTYLTEIEVTKIKLEMNENYSLKTDFEVRTKLEKNLIVRQAIQFLEEDKLELIERNKVLTKENQELKPKALEHDLFMDNKNAQKIGGVAKSFGIPVQTFHQMLRDAKIMMPDYQPYSPYEKYFKTVITPTKAGNVFTSYIYPSGISYIAKRFKLTEVKG